jgi:uncharacterized protein (DUF2267 family)/predicted transcriptional regulator
MPRLVVLNPGDPVLHAVRAIESNNIGTVVVQDQGRIVGILTDRDLAVRVLGRGLDPSTTPVSTVMTTPVATLAPTDGQSDAVSLMQRRSIRRIPLADGGRMVGIVTLDDLLLDEAVPLDQLAAVVASQVGEGGVASSLRSPAAQRSAARAQATYGRLRNQFQADARLETADQADTALKVVLESLVRRLTPGEAKDLISQLPSLLHSELRALPPGPDKQITRKGIEAELSHRLDISPARAAEIATAVGASIAHNVSAGQVEDMRRQFPEELRSILPDTQRALAPHR